MRCPPLLALALLLPLTSGCAYFTSATVGVHHVGSDRVEQSLESSALNSEQPSAMAMLELHLAGVEELYEDDPVRALVTLHEQTVVSSRREAVYALAELSYATAKHLRSREHYAAAAVYAYTYLLGPDWPEAANPYDRRFRWACELYNRGLREALMTDDRSHIELTSGSWSLPVGKLEVAVDTSAFPFSLHKYELLAADEYEVWGLSMRMRDSGLGVPLVASLKRGTSSSTDASHELKYGYVPATCFLRLPGELRDLGNGVNATLELRSAYGTQSVSVGGQRVPLESDFSTALAHALDRSNFWEFSLSGFFDGSKSLSVNGIKLVQPYEPGRIPVVFVHGTASNPANWAEMFNLLESDPELRTHYQCWFYVYSTGNPLLFSAARLREELTELVETLDPDHHDAALRQMVLVGHSQGGLMSKLQVVDGKIDWWNEFAGVPIEQCGLKPEQEARVREVLEFQALPFVQRVIFLSTPHRGSYQADRPFSRFVSGLISLPSDVLDLRENLQNNARLPRKMESQLFTSLDGMKTTSPILRLLAEAPVAPGVRLHSIIPIGDADPAHPEKASDGVVKYKSAHVDDAASELVIPGGHSCQASPPAIREVVRILHEHLAATAVELAPAK